ncbi:MAG: tetratricopeptide repeat protein [Bacteroidetes bacterium]|nr:tetratricopeptide repeat protein [Bacteroidota bacterium]
MKVIGFIIASLALFCGIFTGQAVAKSDPVLDSIRIHISMASDHMEAFNFEKARAELSQGFLKSATRSSTELNYYLNSYSAEILYYEGLFDKAIEYADKAMQFAQLKNDSLLIASEYNLLGLLYQSLNKSEKSVPLLKQSLQWYPSKGASLFPVSRTYQIHSNLGQCYLELKNYEAAARELHLSLILAKDANSGRGQAIAAWALGKVKHAINDNDSALWYFNFADGIAAAAEDADAQLVNFQEIATVYFSSGRKTEALSKIRDGINFLNTNENKIGEVTRREFYGEAARIFINAQQFPDAVEMQNRQRKIDSTIQVSSMRNSVETLQQFYALDSELQKRQIENKQLQQTLSQERKIRVAATLIVLLIGIVLFFVFRNYRIRQQQQHVENENRMTSLQNQKTIETLQLREQLSRDLHDDIGSALSSIGVYSQVAAKQLDNNPKQSKEILDKIQTSTYRTMEAMNDIVWAIHSRKDNGEELTAKMRNFAAELLAPSGISFLLTASDAFNATYLSPDAKRNLLLFFKEAVNNAAKYSGSNTVECNCDVQNGLIVVAVSDNGSGFDRNTITPGTGMSTMESRANGLHGHIEFENRNPGTTVKLIAPVLVQKRTDNPQ